MYKAYRKGLHKVLHVPLFILLYHLSVLNGIGKSNDVFEGPRGATNPLIRSSKKNLSMTKETEAHGASHFWG